ncbi:hypothetical protein OIU77_010549 [Salix suchowensis]|uniref:TF-B3 domain-containing protein n=1 Tax=Salix suchowensis TaxID=1278906 RepID=A0ABQ9A9T7_9ROSI|nr:hypothetical protein OIU77_010549 [Salix suchowensis]
MNFAGGERGYFDKEEPEEEEAMSSKLPFASTCTSSSSSKYQNFLPENQNLWPRLSDHPQQDRETQEPSLNFDKKLEFMELSLGTTNESESSSTDAGASDQSIEREHMFDKVVTPSDVGKLNRLVIPKQHAERYFPLDSSSNEKGLLLNFEDRNGKPWRFRYSYWNSSQSYVMTKGWSRFVKEKRLYAGDIVSFQRGVGETGKHRLFIDWRRRPNAPDPTSFSHLDLQNQLYYPHSVRWAPILISKISPIISSIVLINRPRLVMTMQRSITSGHQRVHFQLGAVHQQGGSHVPVVIDSVPVVHGKTVGKRLRLFGVNMECPTQNDPSSSVTMIGHGTLDSSLSHRLASSSLPPPLQVRESTGAPMQAEFSKKGKTSLSFDLDL